jgi:dolichol kinase/membrane-associated phospholipid phosphatase
MSPLPQKSLPTLTKKLLSIPEIFCLAMAAAGLVAGYFYNDAIMYLVAGLRTPELNWLMLFMTKEGLVAVIALTGATLLLKKRYVEFTLILLAAIVGLESGYLIKKVLQIPRPFATEELSTIALKFTTGYSFPSLHAAFCIGMIPFLGRSFRSRAVQVCLAAVLLVITFSRIYLGLHYLTDLIGGALVGFASAKFWLALDNRFNVGHRLVNQIRMNLELRRQIAHAIAGIVLIFFIKLGIITPAILAGVLLAGTILVVLAKYYTLPVVSRVLKVFERAKDLKLFPGRGAFFFVLGSLTALLLFERQIAVAAIAVLAVGDAVTTVIGIYYGRFKNPFNPQKHLEGTMLAIIISTLAAFTFVDFHLAFFGAAAGIAAESLAFKIFDNAVDDNLLIPLVAGVVMTALG